MWKQLGFRFDCDTDLEGIWESIPLEQRQEFIRVYSMLLVKVTRKQQQEPTELEFENE